jgi:diketogulonate reductase-like aldo/keto reductase
VESALNEQTYKVLDVLREVARELDAPPAHVALAWVQGRPGVTSTIIGARTLEQLDQNLAALDLHLRPEQRARLDEVSRPTLDFPAEFLERAGSFMHGGLQVNGDAAPSSPVAPRPDSPRY